MSKYKEYTRQELYDLVWSTPMVKFAKEFGLSDVGLRKTCVKHDIPTPPLGYWARLNFGELGSNPLRVLHRGPRSWAEFGLAEGATTSKAMATAPFR
jgi:hypothetical protein